ncbi:hypothetical protein COT72_04605 [archaeon CG10_big_fil_rev_8_21_14_0_10_43_11]|nr:MAG: hypothetical protein COT72_04605 [archaeon CG10_big_fil_rev_8_21_14_0_10_43_11]
MIILGITGTIGAGKDVVSRYLKETYGFVMFRMGDLARDIARKRDVEATRKNLQDIYAEYRKKYGKTCFIDLMVEKIKQSGEERIIIDGVRGEWDVEVPKKVFGKQFSLILVDAKPEVRFSRLKKRRRPGFPKTLEEFSQHEAREQHIFGIDKTFARADFTLNNTTTLLELYHKVDALMHSFGVK